MLKQLRFGLLTLLALIAVLPLAAQVRHVTTVNPMSKQSYTEVYEVDYVDIQPQFPGGERGLINFINKTREYPYHAYQRRIEGRVLCSFIVGTDGRVTDVRVVRGANDESLNREAVRVIGKMPRWSVGKVGNHAVPVRVVMPINFRL
ncbi:MAG: energy transducer TonB [Muribaculaceae bacterium]|nr:energy transducer TonB [Muribaculaceae bacterium]